MFWWFALPLLIFFSIISNEPFIYFSIDLYQKYQGAKLAPERQEAFPLLGLACKRRKHAETENIVISKA